MGDDAILKGLLGEFATMSEGDRAIVLEQLGAAECERLQQIVNRGSRPALSPGLSALLADCRNGEAMRQMTAKARTAFLATVRDVATSSLEGAIKPAAPARPVWGQLLPWRKGRA